MLLNMIFWRNGLEALKLRHFDILPVCRDVYLKWEHYVQRMKAMRSNIAKPETLRKESRIMPLYNAQCIKWCCEVNTDAWRPIFRPSVEQECRLVQISARTLSSGHFVMKLYGMLYRITLVNTEWSSTADLKDEKVSAIPLDWIEVQRLRYYSKLDRL